MSFVPSALAASQGGTANSNADSATSKALWAFNDYIVSKIGARPESFLEAEFDTKSCSAFNIVNAYGDMLASVSGKDGKYGLDLLDSVPARSDMVISSSSKEEILLAKQTCLAQVLLEKFSIGLKSSGKNEPPDSSLGTAAYFFGSFAGTTTGSFLSSQASPFGLALALQYLLSPENKSENPLFDGNGQIGSNKMMLCLKIGANEDDTIDPQNENAKCMRSIIAKDITGPGGGKDDEFLYDAFHSFSQLNEIGGTFEGVTSVKSRTTNASGLDVSRAAYALIDKFTEHIWGLAMLSALMAASKTSKGTELSDTSPLTISSGKLFSDDYFATQTIKSNVNFIFMPDEALFVSSKKDYTSGYRAGMDFMKVREIGENKETYLPTLSQVKLLARVNLEAKKGLEDRGLSKSVVGKNEKPCGHELSIAGQVNISVSIPYSICTLAVITRNWLASLLTGAVKLMKASSDSIGATQGSETTLWGVPVNFQNVWTENSNLGKSLRGLADIVQGIVNTLVLILLIIAAFSNIFQLSIGTYGIKKLLPGVLIGFVLSNFSIFGARALYELVQVVANTILSFAVKGSAGIFTKYGDTFSVFKGPEKFTPAGPEQINMLLVFQQHFFNIFLLFATVMVMILAFIFLIRTLILLLLMAVAPISFFSLTVAPLSFIWKSWSKNFFQWLFLPSISFLWLWIGFVFLGAITGTTSGQNSSEALSIGFFPLLLGFGIAIFCLYQAIRAPFKVQGDFKVVMDKWGAAGKSVYNAGATGVKAVGARANAKILSQRAEKNAKITAGNEQLETIQAEKAKQNEKLNKADEDKKRLANKRSRMAEIRKELKNSSLTPEEKASLTDELNDLTSLSAGSIAKNEADATAAIAKETAKETKLQAELIKLKQEDNALKMKAMLSPSNAYAMTKTKIKNAVQSYVTDPAKKNDEILNQMAELDMSSNTGIYARGKAAQKNIDSALAASKKTNEYLLDDSAYRVDKEGAARRKQDTLNSTVIKTVQEDAEKAFTQGIYTDLAHQVAAKPGDFDEGYNKIARENTDKAMSAAVAGEASNLDKPIKNFKPLHEKALYGVLTKNPALKGRLDKVNGHDLIPQGKLTKEETSNDDYVKALGNAGRALRTLANMRDSKYVGAAETAAIQLDALAEKLYGPGFKGVEIKSKAEKGGGAVSPPEWVTYQEAVARYGVADTNDRGRISDAIGKSAVAQAINVANGQPLETIVYTNS